MENRIETRCTRRTSETKNALISSPRSAFSSRTPWSSSSFCLTSISSSWRWMAWAIRKRFSSVWRAAWRACFDWRRPLDSERLDHGLPMAGAPVPVGVPVTLPAAVAVDGSGGDETALPTGDRLSLPERGLPSALPKVSQGEIGYEREGERWSKRKSKRKFFFTVCRHWRVSQLA